MELSIFFSCFLYELPLIQQNLILSFTTELSAWQFYIKTWLKNSRKLLPLNKYIYSLQENNNVKLKVTYLQSFSVTIWFVHFIKKPKFIYHVT